VSAGLGALRLCQKADKILRALPAAGQTGQSALGAGLLQAFYMLDDIRRYQSGHRSTMPGDEDRSSLLHFTDAVGELSLHFNNRKVSGHGYPPNLIHKMTMLTILTIFCVVKDKMSVNIHRFGE
jgi:hypothetical protein